MSLPDITVIIPVFNGANCLAISVKSALEQEAIVEVIIVDDGSTDESLLIARDFAKRYPDQVFAVSQANGGQGLARNTGLRLARGRYCCFLDADDAYAAGFFHLAIRELNANPNVVAVVCRVQLENLHRPVESWHIELIEASIPSNLIARTEVVREFGFPTDSAFRGQAGGEDCAFRQQLHASGPSLFLAKPFHRHRVRAGRYFDLFMDRAFFQAGKVGFKFMTPEEKDGSLALATQHYQKRVLVRNINQVLERLRTVQQSVTDMLHIQGNIGDLAAAEIYLLAWVIRNWPQKGTILVLVNERDAFRELLEKGIRLLRVSTPSAGKSPSKIREGSTAVDNGALTVQRDIQYVNAEKIESILGHLSFQNVALTLLALEEIPEDAWEFAIQKISVMPSGGVLVLRRGGDIARKFHEDKTFRDRWQRVSETASFILLIRK